MTVLVQGQRRRRRWPRWRWRRRRWLWLRSPGEARWALEVERTTEPSTRQHEALAVHPSLHTLVRPLPSQDHPVLSTPGALHRTRGLGHLDRPVGACAMRCDATRWWEEVCVGVRWLLHGAQCLRQKSVRESACRLRRLAVSAQSQGGSTSTCGTHRHTPWVSRHATSCFCVVPLLQGGVDVRKSDACEYRRDLFVPTRNEEETEPCHQSTRGANHEHVIHGATRRLVVVAAVVVLVIVMTSF
jgi:hypothetical protein